MQVCWACVVLTTTMAANMFFDLTPILASDLLQTVGALVVIGSMTLAIAAIAIMIALRSDR